MKGAFKTILAAAAIATIFSFSQKKLEPKPTFFRQQLISIAQDSLKTGDSVKTASDSSQSQQKSDTLQNVQSAKILDEMLLPENLGGDRMVLYEGKVRRYFKNESGAWEHKGVLIAEIGPNAKFAGFVENYNGKNWVAIEQPEWPSHRLLLSLPDLVEHEFLQK